MFKMIFDLLVVTIYHPEDGYSYAPTTLGNVMLFVVIALLLLSMLVMTGRKKEERNAQKLSFSAVAMTLAVVVSFFPIADLPFGGSITLFRMFFLSFIGYLYGTRVGVLTGIAYGFLDLLLKPYVVHPVQLLLDYPIAFGCLGLSGLFCRQKYGMIKGYIVGVLGRFVCHFLTGIIFFSVYAGGQNVLAYSAIYNSSYIWPEAIVTLILLNIPAVRSGLIQVRRLAIQQ